MWFISVEPLQVHELENTAEQLEFLLRVMHLFPVGADCHSVMPDTAKHILFFSHTRDLFETLM